MCHWLTVRTTVAGVIWSTSSPLAYSLGAAHKLYLVVSRKGMCVDQDEPLAFESSKYKDFGIRLLFKNLESPYSCELLRPAEMVHSFLSKADIPFSLEHDTSIFQPNLHPT